MGCADEPANVRNAQVKFEQSPQISKTIKANPSNESKRLINTGKKIPFEDFGWIDQVLKKKSFLAKLTNKQLSQLIKKLKVFQIQAGKQVLEKNQQCFYFYIIGSGEVQVQTKKPLILKSKDTFGEVGLLYGHLRLVSIKTRSNCLFYVLDRPAIIQSLKGPRSRSSKQAMSIISKSVLFRLVQQEKKKILASQLFPLAFQPKQQIIQIEDSGSRIIFVTEGKCSVIDPASKKTTKTYQRQSIIGIHSLALQQDLPLILADSKVQAFAFSKIKLLQIFGDKLVTMCTFVLFYNLIQQSFLAQLQDNVKERLAQSVRLTEVKSGQVIFQKDKVFDRIIFPLNNFLMYQGGKVINCQSVYGISQQFTIIDQKVSKRIIAKNSNKIGVVSTKDLAQIFGSQYVKKLDLTRKRSSKKLISQEFKNVQIEDMQIISKLQQLGSDMAERFIVRSAKADKLYSIRVFFKRKLQSLHMQKYVKDVQDVLHKINFPLFPQFYQFRQNQHYLMFMEQFINGWQLMNLMQSHKLQPYDIRRYTAFVLLSLQYLHKNKIINRDVKPQNIFIDSFDKARIFRISASKYTPTGRCYTIIGTPFFIAPEVLSGQGYSFQSDLYSLGITIHQMLTGEMPYNILSDNPKEIFEQIEKFNEMQAFQKLKSDQRQILRIFLCRNPEKRLHGGYSNLKKLSFFKQIDFQTLLTENNKKSINLPKIIKDSGLKGPLKTLRQQLKSRNLVPMATSKNVDIIENID